jgi:hypothetical protein
MMIPPNLRNRLHYQHPHPRRSQSQTDSFNTVQGGGQFYAPITPQTGSILHADPQTGLLNSIGGCHPGRVFVGQNLDGGRGASSVIEAPAERWVQRRVGCAFPP